MQDSNQPLGSNNSRNPVRPVVAAMPLQRGNYGLPPRPASVAPRPAPQPVAAPDTTQLTPPTLINNPVATASVAPLPPINRPTPAVTTPQFMDVSPPARPAFGPRSPVTITPPPAPAPLAMPIPAQQSTLSADTAAIAPQPQRPLFTPSATPIARPVNRHLRQRLLHPVLHYGLVGVGVLLIIAGGIRFVSAGNTTGDTIAVGAVSANDGRSMTIQFTATDGKLHKFSEASNRALIPGSAVEIAYRSGAPEATARQVAVVKAARNLGTLLLFIGVALVSISGIVMLISRSRARGKQRSNPLTTAVTV